MRILFCSRRFFPAISGMSVYAVNLLRQLVAAGHDVTMVSQYRGDPTGTRVYGGGPPPPVPGVTVIGRQSLGEEAFAEPGGADFERDVQDMVEVILAEHRKQPFDVLHAQYGYPNGWAVLLAARQIGIPTVVSIQGGDGHWVGSCCETHRIGMLNVLNNANALLIGCESFASEVVERLGVSRDIFTIVPGAVDTTRFHPAPGHRPGHAADPVRLLYHGRVDRRKGSLDMMHALKILQDQGVPFAATVSGIGPDHDSTQALAAELGVPVRFSGYADYAAAPPLYREADVFVSPTYAEGFSNTILEAMASGLPSVACYAVGVVDCLRNEENGLLVQPGDIPALAQALRRIIEDASLRRRLAAAALEECRRTYSWDAVGRQIMDVYARVHGEAPRTGFDPVLPQDPSCRFRAQPHLL
ncbi:glycosyltransferase family 4 protein [Paracraurococcus ruber]|uniref:Glycosyl transferase family 1 n=1 Tax=Paracraurococcus ruber TaxID=77675 RepID=A0ABS1D1U7_9PROT|nr:glycosyltransferase family 4 protein [Paracraurococcus ruber]MBK1660483.1 glycosyl transferase family 1 [Paracraurococcus ruber]TDG33651.1 glycosyltransferase family 1 protein [Paracraurococcus ruber]